MISADKTKTKNKEIDFYEKLYLVKFVLGLLKPGLCLGFFFASCKIFCFIFNIASFQPIGM